MDGLFAERRIIKAPNSSVKHILLYGRLLDEVFSDLLSAYVPQAGRNWAGSVVEGLDAADINWINAPDVSLKSNSGLKLSVIWDVNGLAHMFFSYVKIPRLKWSFTQARLRHRSRMSINTTCLAEKQRLVSRMNSGRNRGVLKVRGDLQLLNVQQQIISQVTRMNGSSTAMCLGLLYSIQNSNHISAGSSLGFEGRLVQMGCNFTEIWARF